VTDPPWETDEGETLTDVVVVLEVPVTTRVAEPEDAECVESGT
jgi:hypothetical protein